MDRIAEPDALQREFSSLVPDIILASSSPNRKKLLEAGGTHVSVYVPEIDEERIGATPDDIVMSIARRKIEAYLASPAFDGSRLAVAADTLVLIGGQLLGKPGGDGEAAAMLSMLSGRTQTVLSAIGIKLPGRPYDVLIDRADVIFRQLSASDIAAYVATGECRGAAGAYRLQKTGYTLVERIDGDWTTVVGLPLRLMVDYIRKAM